MLRCLSSDEKEIEMRDTDDDEESQQAEGLINK